MNFNKVILAGNLTRDPELRYTTKGTAVGEISLAINRIWKDEQGQRQEETTFVEVTLWGRQAENAQQFLTKGRGVLVEGRLHLDTWEDKATGQKRTKIKVVAESLQFSPGQSAAQRESSEKARSPLPPAGTSTNYAPPIAAMADALDEDTEIPF